MRFPCTQMQLLRLVRQRTVRARSGTHTGFSQTPRRHRDRRKCLLDCSHRFTDLEERLEACRLVTVEAIAVQKETGVLVARLATAADALVAVAFKASIALGAILPLD